MVQCAVAAGGIGAGVLHGCGADSNLYEWRGDCLSKSGGEWVSVADGSGVGEGGAGRIEWKTVSVGGYNQPKPGQLLILRQFKL